MNSKTASEILAPKLLKKVMGKFDLTALYFALIFGSYGAAQMTAEGWAGIPMLLLAAITFLLPTAMASYELGSVFPGEGGTYLWAHKAFGPFHGFISGWLSWVPIFLLLPLGVSTVIAHLQFAVGYDFSLSLSIFLQIVLIVIVTLISCLKLKLSQGYIKAMFGVSLGTAVIVFVVAITSYRGVNPIDSNVYDFNVFEHGAMYSAAILWLLGVEVPFNMGTEIKDHRNSTKHMLIWGTAFLLLGYLLGIFGTLALTPVDSIDATTGISRAVGSVYPFLGIIVALMVSFAVVSQDVAYMNSYSRLLFVSGLEKRLPESFSYLTKNTVPIIALLVQCIGAALVVIIFSSIKNLASAFQLYLASLVVVWVSALLYVFCAIPIVRQKYADYYKENKVWKIPFGKVGMWVIVVAGVFFSLVAIYYVFATPWTADLSVEIWRSSLALLSIGLFVLGVIIYWSGRKRVKSADIVSELRRENIE